MSMLAEPKRKVKWSLNPRGNLWADETNKFGQKLLEKMGWEKGKGLGKFEDGKTQHVKVAWKGDNCGVGWKDSDAWVAHQDDFNALLAKLNKKTPETEKLSYHNVEDESYSLEARSKSLKHRVHYQKFVQGKDVSRYTKQDMDCIFGRKEQNLPPDNHDLVNDGKDSKKRGNKAVSLESTEENFSNYNGVVTFKNTNSMADYFSQKLREKNEKISNATRKEEMGKSTMVNESGIDDVPRPHNHHKKRRIDLELGKDEKSLSKAAKKAKNYYAVEDSKSHRISQSHLCNGETKDRLKSCLKYEKDKTVRFDSALPSIVSSSNIDVKVAKTNAGKDSSKCDSSPTEDSYQVSSSAKTKPETETTSSLQRCNEKELGESLFKYQQLNKKFTSDCDGNTWASTLKLAEKMSHYNSVLENIKHHKVLSTTNLLDIKGYGTF